MTRKQSTLSSRMQREVRKAEAVAREANLRKLRHQEITGPVLDAGTGQTILKMQRHQPPLRTLVEGKKIGVVELLAAGEIELAVFSVTTRGRLAAALLERVDFGREDERDWPYEIAAAVRRYLEWSTWWTSEHTRTGNPMLEVVWDAVIDETPISVIAQQLRCGPQRAQRAIICGLRHYAAFARLVTGEQRQAWLDAAQHVFPRTLPDTTS